MRCPYSRQFGLLYKLRLSCARKDKYDRYQDAVRYADQIEKSINWWLVGAVLMLIICGISLYYCIITGIQLRGTGGISGSFCESLQRGISANTYQLPEEEDVLYYYDDHGNLQVISVKPGTCGVAYGRMSFFENGKLSPCLL